MFVKTKISSGLFEKAASNCDLVFLENNTDFIMQKNHIEFYIDPIRTYRNSMHYYDETVIKLDNYFCAVEKAYRCNTTRVRISLPPR